MVVACSIYTHRDVLAQIRPSVCIHAHCVIPVQIGLQEGHTSGGDTVDDSGVTTAVVATDLDEVAGTSLGEERGQSRFALVGDATKPSHARGVVEQIVDSIGPGLSATGVDTKAQIEYILGITLALFAGTVSGELRANFHDSGRVIGQCSFGDGVQPFLDSLLFLGGHIHWIVGQLTAVLLVVGLRSPGDSKSCAGGVEQLNLVTVHGEQPNNIKFISIVTSANCLTQPGTAVELTRGGGFDCVGICRNCGQRDISGTTTSSGYRVRDEGPLLAVGDTDIDQPQFISSAANPGITRASFFIARGLQIGRGVNRLTTGGSQGEDLGVTTGGQGIVGGSGRSKSGDGDHTAQTAQSEQREKQGN